MPWTINLFQMKTRRYKSVFRNLDESECIGDAKVLPMRITREPAPDGDFSDNGEGVTWVIVPKAMLDYYGKKVIAQSIRDYYTSEGCSHDWDCCGCPSTHASILSVDRNRFTVGLSFSRNY